MTNAERPNQSKSINAHVVYKMRCRQLTLVLVSKICLCFTYPDSHTLLPNNCLRPFFVFVSSFFVVSLEMSLFPSIFVPSPSSLLHAENTSYVFLSGWRFSTFVTTGWIFSLHGEYKYLVRFSFFPFFLFSFRMVFFYLVTTGWIFGISVLCENSINQSKFERASLTDDPAVQQR